LRRFGVSDFALALPPIAPPARPISAISPGAASAARIFPRDTAALFFCAISSKLTIFLTTASFVSIHIKIILALSPLVKYTFYMDRMQEYTSREEIERADLDNPYDCWECGTPCPELTQAPWTARRMLIGSCCMPIPEEQPENAVSAEEAAILDAEELAIFGKPAARERVNPARKAVA